MLNIFNNKNLKQYKVGYVVDDAGNEYQFKYNKLSQSEISEIEILSSVSSTNTGFVIMTTDPFNFHPSMKIKINNIYYHILGITIQEHSNENGIFRSNLIRTQFISLGR